MTPAYTWLWIVLIIEGALLAGCLALLLGRAAWLRHEARRWDSRSKEARLALIEALETGRAAGWDLQAVPLLPRRVHLALIMDLAGHLSGP
ncbi:MAG TPA: hypothetical protein VJ805_02460, partial [Nitrospiraceae bacterium]|nr:hypothetical protein [Nitrospiraceae bacterium]